MDKAPFLKKLMSNSFKRRLTFVEVDPSAFSGVANAGILVGVKRWLDVT